MNRMLTVGEKMSRYKASALHLFGSACVLMLAFLLIYRVWFPGKLFSAVGGSDLLRLLAGVDLILGPLVMLIIFDHKKKWLKLDIALVLLCQLGFLGYGLWTIFSARPVYIAFVEDRFYMVRANEVDAADQAKAGNPVFKSLPYLGPVYVGTRQPADQKIRNEIALSGLAGMGIQNLPQYFVPYTDVQQQVKSMAKTSAQLLFLDQASRLRLQEEEKKYAEHPVLFLMLVRKSGPLAVVIRQSTGQVIDII